MCQPLCSSWPQNSVLQHPGVTAEGLEEISVMGVEIGRAVVHLEEDGARHQARGPAAWRRPAHGSVGQGQRGK